MRIRLWMASNLNFVEFNNIPVTGLGRNAAAEVEITKKNIQWLLKGITKKPSKSKARKRGAK